jgi:hypothetical protein
MPLLCGWRVSVLPAGLPAVGTYVAQETYTSARAP